MLLASNMPAIRGLPQLMRRLGVHAAVVGRLDYIYIPEPVLAGEAIAAEDVQKRTHLDALLALTGDEVRRLGFDFHDRLAMSSPPGSSCSENIQRSLFVSAGGDVSPCVYTNIPSPQANDGRRVFGNIEATDPLAIWADPAYRSFRQALALGPPDRVCRQCAKRGRAD